MDPNEIEALMLIGESKRIKDKAFIEFRGKELFRHGYEVLEGIFSKVLIVCDENVKDRLQNFPIISENLGIGPLGGVYTGMQNLSNDYVFVAACDMPFLKQSIIEFLCCEAGDDGVIPLDEEGRPEPLHAIYRREKVLELGNLCLEGGSIKNLIDRMNLKFIQVDEIKKHDPKLMTFRNINTKEDLEKFENEP